MYFRAKVYKCSLCGKVDLEATYRYTDEPTGLPHKWTGSSSKRGQCFCDTCSQAVKEAAESIASKSN